MTTYLSCMELQFEDGFDLVLLAPPSRRLEHLSHDPPQSHRSSARTGPVIAIAPTTGGGAMRAPRSKAPSFSLSQRTKKQSTKTGNREREREESADSVSSEWRERREALDFQRRLEYESSGTSLENSEEEEEDKTTEQI